MDLFQTCSFFQPPSILHQTISQNCPPLFHPQIIFYVLTTYFCDSGHEFASKQHLHYKSKNTERREEIYGIFSKIVFSFLFHFYFFTSLFTQKKIHLQSFFLNLQNLQTFPEFLDSRKICWRKSKFCLLKDTKKIFAK